MVPSNLQVIRCSGLVLEVHTVGYSEMGESIVTFLKDGDSVLLTVVTDSFKTENADVVRGILADNGHPVINVFIWTHPDEDHSVGIESLLDEFDPNRKSTIYMPANIAREMMPCAAAKKAFGYLVKNYASYRRHQLKSVLTVGNQVVTLNAFKIRERLTSRKITGAFQFLLPDSSLTIRGSYRGAKNSGDINNFSLVYVLELNGIHYFFGGDLTRQSIRLLDGKDKHYFENIRYVKIPHHGSVEPLKLVDMLSPYQHKKAVATTTVFKASHPYKETLDRYATMCEHVSSTHRGPANYGSIRLDFNLSRMQVPAPVCEGNAKVVRPDLP